MSDERCTGAGARAAKWRRSVFYWSAKGSVHGSPSHLQGNGSGRGKSRRLSGFGVNAYLFQTGNIMAAWGE